MEDNTLGLKLMVLGGQPVIGLAEVYEETAGASVQHHFAILYPKIEVRLGLGFLWIKGIGIPHVRQATKQFVLTEVHPLVFGHRHGKGRRQDALGFVPAETRFEGHHLTPQRAHPSPTNTQKAKQEVTHRKQNNTHLARTARSLEQQHNYGRTLKGKTREKDFSVRVKSKNQKKRIL